MIISSTGGYAVRNKESFEQKHKCPVCTNLLKNPVQLDCGHRRCRQCITPVNNYVECIECDEKTLFSDIKQDKGFEKDMNVLSVDCISCDWFGSLKNYQEHLELLHSQFKCSYCGEIFNSQLLLHNHTERLCVKALVNCVLSKYGCKQKILRGDLETHYQTVEHQQTLIFCIEQMILQWKKQHQILDMIDTELKMETSEIPLDATTTVSTTNTMEKSNDDVKHIHQIIELFFTSINAIKNELIRLNNESLQKTELVETLEKHQATLKISSEESNNILNATKTNLMILQQNLSMLNQAYEDQQVTSYDGTLIWKIDKFAERMRDAQSERQVSIYSAPFRSSPTGYKMRARLYLYGDGNARRTHMSLFFVLMRSPYDAILTYPFSSKVTFCLFDQSGEKRHIIDSFRPDTKSSSFQRPRSYMNIASGIPKFASLSIFDVPNNGYVRDDTMFIKIIVDFENTHKSMLNYVFNLNPGLPMHTQQMLIRKETEQRALPSQTATTTNAANNNTKKN